MSWTEVANQTMGGQAPAVIQYLNNINPNYDWSNALQATAQRLQSQYSDGGWMDPSRGSVAGIAAEAVATAAQLDPNGAAGYQNSLPSLYAQQRQQDQSILAEQSTHGDDGFGGLAGLAIGGLGAYFGMPYLGAAFQAANGNFAGAGLSALTAGFGGGGDLPLTDSWNYDPSAYANMGGGSGVFQTLSDAPWGVNPAATGADLPLTDAWNYDPSAYTTMGGGLPEGYGALELGGGVPAPQATNAAGQSLWGSAAETVGPGGLPAVAQAGGQAGASTALSRVLNGTATAADYASLGLQALPGLVGAYASSRQSDAYKGLADQFASYGAPFRQRLSDLYADPSKFLSSPEVQKPVQMGSDILARSLSVGGNPIGSGNALQQLQSYSADQLFGRLGQEKDRLAGYGGIASYNAAAPAAASNVIQSNGNTANALGAAASNVFNPPKTLAEQLAAFKTLSG